MRPVQFASLLLLALVACQPTPASGGKPGTPPPQRRAEPTAENRPAFPWAKVVVEAKDGAIPLKVEVARNDPERSYGLMFKKELPADQGMVFVFQDNREHTFWMRNTFIPLDMIFIGEDRKVVGVYENAEPFSLARMSVGQPSRYVLEVNAGWARSHGVGPGTQIRFEGVE